MIDHRIWDVIGAPSSAGAYAPGQEKTPAALRAVGLLEQLDTRGVRAQDFGDVEGFRWQADPSRPRAMNANTVRRVAGAVARAAAASFAAGHSVLVVGGDCTIELGTVAGALAQTESLGLIYFDLDSDLNTPMSTEDGALDWMGVAHLLAVDQTIDELTGLGPRVPMLGPEQVHLFASGNIKPFERGLIGSMAIQCTDLETVQADPVGAARALADWAAEHKAILVHLDVDVLDYLLFPLAENTRRNIGLSLDQLLGSLQEMLQFPNLIGLTIAEINPDHGLDDGSTLRDFVQGLAQTMAGTYNMP
jgi:arginase